MDRLYINEKEGITEKEYIDEKEDIIEKENIMKKENRKVYWMIFRKTIDNTSMYPNQYVTATLYHDSYNDVLSKINTVVRHERVMANYLKYSRGNNFNDVVINNEESLHLAYEFMGEDIFDPKKGIVVFLGKNNSTAIPDHLGYY